MPYRLSKSRIFLLLSILSIFLLYTFLFPKQSSANPISDAATMVTKRHLRIAVLECDEPVGKTKEKYGGYGGLFKELLQNGVERYPDLYKEKPPELEVSKFDVVNKMDEYPKLEDVDAILLTGSSTSKPASTHGTEREC